jgi:hypothetical protein
MKRAALTHCSGSQAVSTKLERFYMVGGPIKSMKQT